MRLPCILLAVLLAGCSAERVGKAIGEAFVAPFAAEATAPADAPVFRHLGSAPPGQAILYVYRTAVSWNRGGYPEVAVGGQQKFALKSQGYRPVLLDPGEHEIRVECGWNWFPPTAARTLSVEAGGEYYVRVIPTLMREPGQAMDPRATPPAPSPFGGGCKTGRVLMMLIPKDQALAEISQTRLLTE